MHRIREDHCFIGGKRGFFSWFFIRLDERGLFRRSSLRARRLSACGVPCPGGAAERSARTGSGIRCHTHALSTRQPLGSSAAGFRRSKLSACLAAPLPAGKCRFHGRSSLPAPSIPVFLIERWVLRSGSYRCRETALLDMASATHAIVQQHQRICARRASRCAAETVASKLDQVAARSGCPGSQGGSSRIKQNRLNSGWQAIFPDFRRKSRGIVTGEAVGILSTVGPAGRSETQHDQVPNSTRIGHSSGRSAAQN